MPKILFIAAHRPGRSPSQRFRFEQYFDYLKSEGFQCDFSYLISKSDDEFFYKPGHYFRKALILFKSTLKRISDVLRARHYDIVFIQRESFFLGTTLFEKLFGLVSSAKIVFDYDDSIWLSAVSERNKKLSWLKDPKKTEKIIKAADLVFAGNQFLADYAFEFNQKVKIIPTTIDTNLYSPVHTKKDPEKICIGWSGSFSTIPHFKTALPALIKIKEKYGDQVSFKIIGDGDYFCKELNTQGLPWSAETEVEDLCSMDIGIMPLPQTEWAKGKCGLKGLQYMALEIPTILSPVGVNSEIISDGVNGFLADSQDEWIEKISKLIEDKSLRERLGKAGRKTVEEHYSVLAQRENYAHSFRELIAS